MTAAIRSPRYHRSTPVGLYASGFREGHHAGRRDACRQLWPYLTAEGRELAKAIAGEDDE